MHYGWGGGWGGAVMGEVDRNPPFWSGGEGQLQHNQQRRQRHKQQQQQQQQQQQRTPLIGTRARLARQPTLEGLTHAPDKLITSSISSKLKK